MGWAEVKLFVQTGLIPSITGGFYFNVEASEDVVLLQFYGWLALFVIPLSVALDAEVSPTTSITYSILLAFLFLLLGSLNARLQAVLDEDPPPSREDEVGVEAPGANPDVGQSESSLDSATADATDDFEGAAKAVPPLGGVGEAIAAALREVDVPDELALMPTPQGSGTDVPAVVAATPAVAAATPDDAPVAAAAAAAAAGAAPGSAPSAATAAPVAPDDTPVAAAAAAAAAPPHGDPGGRSMIVPEHIHPLWCSRTKDYTCDICGVHGVGWSWNCKMCNFDAHPLCAGADDPDLSMNCVPSRRKDLTEMLTILDGVRASSNDDCAHSAIQPSPGSSSTVESVVISRPSRDVAWGISLRKDTHGQFKIRSVDSCGPAGDRDRGRLTPGTTIVSLNDVKLNELSDRRELMNELQNALTLQICLMPQVQLGSDSLEEGVSQPPDPSVLVSAHEHRLKRTLHPYENLPSFLCDICLKLGQGWSYHCSICHFDAHPSCVGVHDIGAGEASIATVTTSCEVNASSETVLHENMMVHSDLPFRDRTLPKHSGKTGEAQGEGESCRPVTTSSLTDEDGCISAGSASSAASGGTGRFIVSPVGVLPSDSTAEDVVPSSTPLDTTGVHVSSTASAMEATRPQSDFARTMQLLFPTPLSTSVDSKDARSAIRDRDVRRRHPDNSTVADQSTTVAATRPHSAPMQLGAQAATGEPRRPDKATVLSMKGSAPCEIVVADDAPLCGDAVIGEHAVHDVIEGDAPHCDDPGVDSGPQHSGVPSQSPVFTRQGHRNQPQTKHVRLYARSVHALEGMLDGCSMEPLERSIEGAMLLSNTNLLTAAQGHSPRNSIPAPFCGMLDGCTMEMAERTDKSPAGAPAVNPSSRRRTRVFVRPPRGVAMGWDDASDNLDFERGSSAETNQGQGRMSRPRRVTIRLRSPHDVDSGDDPDAVDEFRGGTRPRGYPRPLSEPFARPRARNGSLDERLWGRRCVRSSVHHHPLYNATTRQTGWSCNMCHSRHNPLTESERQNTRFRCSEGCDFDLCHHCMIRTLFLNRGLRFGGDHDRDLASQSTLQSPLGLPSAQDSRRRSLDALSTSARLEPLELPFYAHHHRLDARRHRRDSQPRSPPQIADPEDTSPGSLHFFEDSSGNRVYYRFGEGIVQDPRRTLISAPSASLDPYSDFVEWLPLADRPAWQSQRPPADPLADMLPAWQLRRQSVPLSIRKLRVSDKRSIRFGCLTFKLAYDRLALSHALDRDSLPRLQVPMAALLAGLSAYVAFQVSAAVGPTATVFVWFAAGTAQYSLVKSVQPDPGSSLVNERGTSYMRCVYFCIFGGLFLVVNDYRPERAQVLYGVHWGDVLASPFARDFALALVVCLPLLWLFGHLPMWWRTFLHWSIEQVDTVCFGGGGSKSLAGALARLGATTIALLCCIRAAAPLSKAQATGTDAGLFQLTCVVFAFLLSRCPADPRLILTAVRTLLSRRQHGGDNVPPSSQLLAQRLGLDPLRAISYGVLFFILHVTDAISGSRPYLSPTVLLTTVTVGFVRHHLIHQLGRPYPWLAFKGPMLRGNANDRRRHLQHFSVASFLEHDLLYPLVVAYGIASDAHRVFDRFGNTGGAVVLALSTFKLLRAGYSDGTLLWLSLAVAWFAGRNDLADLSEGILLDTFIVHMLLLKGEDFLRKLGFAFVYNAPGNYRAMSAFHALMYPLQVPHTAMLIFQALIASLFSAPLYPVAGSPLFLVSYLRPVKFFERRYTTTRLENKTDATIHNYTVGATADNLNSLFYMECQSRLREQLATDVEGGTFGHVSAGDLFLLMCNQGTMHMISVLHIIDKGHGYVSFQLRGLELAGTFCQNREAEALDLEDEWQNDQMQCETCHACLPHCNRTPCTHVLPIKLMRDLRWKTWSREQSDYTLQKGYSISLLNANSYFPDIDSLRLFRELMFKSAMYFCFKSDRLEEWLVCGPVATRIKELQTLCGSKDELVENGTKGSYLSLGHSGGLDWDYRRRGRARQCGLSFDLFMKKYGEWVEFSATQMGIDAGKHNGDRFVNLMHWCFAVSIVLRRLMAAFTPNTYCIEGVARRGARSDRVRREELYRGYHRLFEGRVDLQSADSQWASHLPNFVQEILVSAARMALRLYQDQYADPGCFESHDYLLETLQEWVGHANARNEWVPLLMLCLVGCCPGARLKERVELWSAGRRTRSGTLE